MKKLVALVLAAALSVGATACGGTTSSSSEAASAAANSAAAPSSEAASSTAAVSGSISISGSSALYPLAKDAIGKFKATNPDASITLNAGGSGTGLKQVAAGTVDIGNSDVFADEKLPADSAKSLVDHKVCVITMAPIVSPDVGEKVTSLTTQQLTDIFTAKTKNWKEVGGPDEAITLVTRPSTSGTRALFKQYALGGKEEASNKSLETDDSGTLLQTVSQHKGAIGYVALSYLVNNTSVKKVSIDGVEPSLENTYSGKYKVWGYEHMYTKGEATGVAKALIEYMQTEEYGKDMEAMGYNVASKMQVQRDDPKAAK
ncbi:MAG: phosphate ABC transporter substrate-binding protein [Oscillospiraceae bacterium]|jgi:phosphate transport system substrate-binding protein|nr:phosphate ABC transporter substrate-binding protein [Oscillospiraceae bacterium]MCI1989857.1 phosphate ABC transporter substrate-binding protein [Oscillospiraceae bacterium]MCI2034918.1 phosphate ABC transporter substrate-binding protein [Oscillospiraceae bacterium]